MATNPEDGKDKRVYGVPFKKGNKVGKGHGRPSKSDEQREYEKLVKGTTKNMKQRLRESFTIYSEKELRWIERNWRKPTNKVLDTAVMSIWRRAVRKGDIRTITLISEFVYGKEIERMDITSKDKQLEGPVVYIPKNGREK